jgi:hypothetical protein
MQKMRLRVPGLGDVGAEDLVAELVIEQVKELRSEK